MAKREQRDNASTDPAATAFIAQHDEGRRQEILNYAAELEEHSDRESALRYLCLPQHKISPEEYDAWTHTQNHKDVPLIKRSLSERLQCDLALIFPKQMQRAASALSAQHYTIVEDLAGVPDATLIAIKGIRAFTVQALNEALILHLGIQRNQDGTLTDQTHAAP